MLDDQAKYDARVLSNFVDAGGRLLGIPAQHKKLLVILRWLAEDFQPGRRYPEHEVNRVIERRHMDFATLRRLLVDEDLMQRRRGVYWRTGSLPNVGHDPASMAGPALIFQSWRSSSAPSRLRARSAWRS